MTILGLYLIVAAMIIGGLALDVANAMRVKTHLQIAADSAAHAAIMAREVKSEAEARSLAVSVAQVSLPKSEFGDTIVPSDIKFGRYDEASGQFQVIPGDRSAVLVDVQRLADRDNSMGTYFLKFLGMWEMDIVTQAVYETYYPTCYLEGFVAEGRVDVQSNNYYGQGFCIHSNSHVEVNNNNTFDDGTIVSMPDRRDLVIPANGFNKNPGLERALRDGAYHIRVLDRLNTIMADFDNPASEMFRSDMISRPVKRTTVAPSQNLDETVWQAGEVHEADCGALVLDGTVRNGTQTALGALTDIIHVAKGGNGGGNGGGGNGGGGGGGGNSTLRIPANTTLVGGAIYTDCRISIGSNVTLEDMVIVSMNADTAAISGASNVTLGRNDGCQPGGGVQIVTMGGVNFPAKLSIYGGQIIAKGNIDFEANANGIEGVSLVAGGEIDSTSNMAMGFCDGAGLEHSFRAEYFRMVR